MVKRIDVSTQKYPNTHVIIDDGDYELVASMGKWVAQHWGSGRVYAVKHLGGGRTRIAMHRLIAGAKHSHQIVDHINGDPLDNRRENLRVVGHTENARNRRGSYKSASFKGVWQDSGKWRASVTHSGKTRHLGTFFTEEAAAIAYDEYAREEFGEFGKTNASILERQGIDVEQWRLSAIDAENEARKRYVRPPRKDNAQGLVGVSFNRSKDRWVAYINANRKRYHLGYFTCPVKAADAYDRAALKYHGEFARTNKMIREEARRKKKAA